MQHALRMRVIILSSVACLAVQYIFTLTHNRRDWRDKFIADEMCFDFLYKFGLTYFLF